MVVVIAITVTCAIVAQTVRIVAAAVAAIALIVASIASIVRYAIDVLGAPTAFPVMT